MTKKERMIQRRRKRRLRKLKVILLFTAAILSAISIITFVLTVNILSHDGLILAAVINIPAAMYLLLFAWANNFFVIKRKDKKPKRQPVTLTKDNFTEPEITPQIHTKSLSVSTPANFIMDPADFPTSQDDFSMIKPIQRPSNIVPMTYNQKPVKKLRTYQPRPPKI